MEQQQQEEQQRERRRRQQRFPTRNFRLDFIRFSALIAVGTF